MHARRFNPNLTIMKMKYLNGFNDNVLDSWLYLKDGEKIYCFFFRAITSLNKLLSVYYINNVVKFLMKI